MIFEYLLENILNCYYWPLKHNYNINLDSCVMQDLRVFDFYQYLKWITSPKPALQQLEDPKLSHG